LRRLLLGGRELFLDRGTAGDLLAVIDRSDVVGRFQVLNVVLLVAHVAIQH
jgi:hypothetical protein